MRINEQIDQGSKLSQPSRSTLGSGGGEGSTLSSNGTLGADICGVFVARGGPSDAGVKKLDERVIFDALKLTGDPQSMSPVGGVGSGVVIPASNSAAVGAAVVTKRRHQGGDKKDNPNRRSWKAFMPPTYPEFAERLELSPGESGEKRLSGAGIPVSPLHPVPSLLASSIPSTSSPPLTTPFSHSPVSSGGPQTPPVSSSPSFTPTVSPIPPHLPHPHRKQPLQLHSQKLATALHSPSKEQPPSETTTCAQPDTPQPSTSISQQAERKSGEQSEPTPASLCVRSISEEPPQIWDITAARTSDNERDSPLLEHDQDTVPLIPPKPVFCPPTKARTWPRSMKGSKRSLGHGRVLPILPPLPPILGEESDEESLYLLDPPSPFLQEGEGVNYGGLPLSPCISQEGGENGLLGWPPPTVGLREKTASELCFEEDERRILQELEEDEMDREQEKKEEEERLEMEERNWQAVLKLESSETCGLSWEVEEEESQLQDWETQQLASSGHWPLLTPPVGFGGSEAPSASPCPSSEAGSDELFLELERQCLEEDADKSNVSEKRDLSHTSEYSDTCDKLLEVNIDQADARHECDITELYDEDCVVTSSHDIIHHVEHTDQTEPRVTQMNQNSPECAQSCFSLEDIDQSQDQLKICIPCNSEGNNLDQNYTSYIADADALDSESSDIQTLHQDRTVPSDTILTVSYEQPDSYSDIVIGASSDHEQQEQEEVMKQDETSDIHISLEHGFSPPENLNADVECSMNLGIFKTDLEGVEIEESFHQSPECSVLEDEAESEVRNSHCETVSHEDTVSSEPAQVTMEMTSDQEGAFLKSEKEEISVSMEVFVEEEVSSHEWEVTEAVQGTTSTPKSNASYSQLDSPNISIESAPPSPLPLNTTTTKHESRTAGLESKDGDAFVATDSFVYLAVAVPPQYHQDGPPSPSVESGPPSPLPKCCPEPEEGAFLSSDSFVYLAAPERLVSDGGSACEDCQDLDSESEETRSGVDFVLGSMTGDSEWDSDGSGLDTVHQQRDQWEQLEPGLLYGLFNEVENQTSSQEGVESCDHDYEATCEARSMEEISPLKHDLDLDTKVK